MGKSVLEKEKREKRSKVVTMPRKGLGKDAAAGGKGGKGAAVKAAEQGEKEASKKAKKEKQPKGARKALRKAVKKAVKDSCTEIANSLVTHTEDGDMRCAAVMLSLMDKREKDGEDDKPREGPSAAELLASEPEWDEEMEKKRGTGSGQQGTGSTVAA